MAFATYMKNIRLDREESQVSMAKKMNISVTALKLIENGTTKFPSDKLLENICEYTKSSQNDVIMHILFDEEDIKNRYLACRYLAYMYLLGWNITVSPFELHLTENYMRTFDAKIIKKRENKNIVIVTSCNRFFERISINDVLEDKNFIGYLGDAVSLTLSIMDSFRGLHILFDNKDEKQHQMYDLFEKEKYHHLDFYIDVVLFDPDRSEVIGNKRVTK